jgi:hypothetical protein
MRGRIRGRWGMEKHERGERERVKEEGIVQSNGIENTLDI